MTVFRRLWLVSVLLVAVFCVMSFDVPRVEASQAYSEILIAGLATALGVSFADWVAMRVAGIGAETVMASISAAVGSGTLLSFAAAGGLAVTVFCGVKLIANAVEWYASRSSGYAPPYLPSTGQFSSAIVRYKKATGERYAAPILTNTINGYWYYTVYGRSCDYAGTSWISYNGYENPNNCACGDGTNTRMLNQMSALINAGVFANCIVRKDEVGNSDYVWYFDPNPTNEIKGFPYWQQNTGRTTVSYPTQSRAGYDVVHLDTSDTYASNQAFYDILLLNAQVSILQLKATVELLQAFAASGINVQIWDKVSDNTAVSAGLIQELLGAIRAGNPEALAVLQQIKARADAIGNSADNVAAGIPGVVTAVQGVAPAVSQALSTPLQGINTSIQALNPSIAAVETAVKGLDNTAVAINAGIGQVKGGVDALNTGIGTLNTSLDTLNTSVDGVNTSVRTLDNVVSLALNPTSVGDETRWDALKTHIGDRWAALLQRGAGHFPFTLVSAFSSPDASVGQESALPLLDFNLGPSSPSYQVDFDLTHESNYGFSTIVTYLRGLLTVAIWCLCIIGIIGLTKQL